MDLKTTCPGCGAAFRLPDAAAGRRFRCARCKTIFPASVASPAPQVPDDTDSPTPPSGRGRGWIVLAALGACAVVGVAVLLATRGGVPDTERMGHPQGSDKAPLEIPSEPEPRATVVAGAGELTGVRPLRSIQGDYSTSRFLVSTKFNRLLVQQASFQVMVVDSTSGRSFASPRFESGVTGISLSPDESTLFVIEALEVETSRRVHRLDVASGKWAMLPLPEAASGVLAVDGRTFVLTATGRYSGLGLYRWEGESLAELAWVRLPGMTGAILDHTSMRVYVSFPNNTLRTVAVGASDLKERTSPWDRLPADRPRQSPTALSSDGTRLYFGADQTDARNLSRVLRTFPEPIVAATRDLAFAARAFYDARTGEKRGEMPYEATIRATSADGTAFWTFDPSSKTMDGFAIEAGKGREPVRVARPEPSADTVAPDRPAVAARPQPSGVSGGARPPSPPRKTRGEGALNQLTHVRQIDLAWSGRPPRSTLADRLYEQPRYSSRPVTIESTFVSRRRSGRTHSGPADRPSQPPRPESSPTPRSPRIGRPSSC